MKDIKKLHLPLMRTLVVGTLSLGFCSVSLAQRQRNQDFQGQGQGGPGQTGFQTQRGGGFSRQAQYNGGMRSTGDSFNDKYGVIPEHNIFLRDRGRPVFVQPTQRRQLTAEESYIITGVIEEGDEYHAYAEDIQRGAVLKLRIGDAIANGKITDMDLDDGVCYTVNGTERWIDTGSNLTGTQVLSVSGERVNSAVSSFGFDRFGGGGNGNNGNGNGGNGRNGGNFGNTAVAPAGVAPPPLPEGGAANLSIEERMRLRRMSEGMAPPPGAAQPAPQVEAPQPVQQAPEAPADGMSIEERMRLRRAQELGGR